MLPMLGRLEGGEVELATGEVWQGLKGRKQVRIMREPALAGGWRGRGPGSQRRLPVGWQLGPNPEGVVCV